MVTPQFLIAPKYGLRVTRGSPHTPLQRGASSVTALATEVCAPPGRKLVCVVLVAQSCLTLCNPVNSSPPGFSVHGFCRQ